jgi:hypothetical protein
MGLTNFAAQTMIHLSDVELLITAIPMECAAFVRTQEVCHPADVRKKSDYERLGCGENSHAHASNVHFSFKATHQFPRRYGWAHVADPLTCERYRTQWQRQGWAL